MKANHGFLRMSRLAAEYAKCYIAGTDAPDGINGANELLYLVENPSAHWTESPPAEGGTYWHWNGDIDCAPLPMFVMWSGFSGKCFVSMGQLGITEAVNCDEYGGWWMPLETPALPKNPHAQALGKLGRKVCSEAQARASRLNGKKPKRK